MHHQHSHHGLRYIKSSKVPSDKLSRDYRTFISSHHKEVDNTYAVSKAVQLKVNSQWTRWVNYIQQNFSWKPLLAIPLNFSSFCISSAFLPCQCVIIITNIRSSIKSIKSTAPTSKQPIKIKFVKKGTRVKNKQSFPSRILHQASDWVLLGDLDSTFSFHLT